MTKRSWLWAVLAFLPALGAGARERAAYVAAGSYLETLVGEIGRAKRSIQAYVYVFALRNREGALTLRLADALAAARARGVRVEVTLDEFGGFEGTFAPGRGNNDAAYRYLESRGVDVAFDAAPQVVHAKAVVIDGETVVAGSNNWSEAAFTQNVEACLLVRDRAVAAAALRDLGRTGRAKRAPEEATAALVPEGFLTDGLGTLVNGGAERPLDVYLLLCRLRTEADGVEWLRVDVDWMAKELGLAANGERSYRQEITMILRRKLLKRYGLVTDLRLDRGGDAEVRLKEFPGGGAVAIPAGYWTWDWDQRLRLRTKAMFLLNRYYMDQSATRPRWSLSGSTLIRRHKVSETTISGGTADLRRANLVEVEYADLPADGSGRVPNTYTPEALYDPRLLEERWSALEKAHGREAVDRARDYAALVYEDGDATLVERLIGLEKERGRERMEAAAAKIKAKHPSNPKRSAGYFIGILQAPQREE